MTDQYDFRIAAIRMLRVNVKSLAAESRIIREEARRAGPQYSPILMEHRRGRVREESRYASLALAFVRGRKYSSTESKPSRLVDIKRLHEKVKRFWYPGQNGEAAIIKWVTGS